MDHTDRPQEPGESGEPTAGSLSHIETDVDGSSRSTMVDVGRKAPGGRTALARAMVEFPGDLLEEVLGGRGPKGPIEEVARVAGILAAKRTGDLIPMCHPLGLDFVEIRFRQAGDDTLEITCRAACHGKTGVEMEAMVGASVAALTVYDMTKALGKGIRVAAVELLEKTGGKGGTWRRDGTHDGARGEGSEGS